MSKLKNSARPSLCRFELCLCLKILCILDLPSRIWFPTESIHALSSRRVRIVNIASVVRSSVRPLVSLFVRSFIRSFICSIVRSSTHSFICSFNGLFLCSFVLPFLCSFDRSFDRSFIRSFVRSFVCWFVRSFLHSFIPAQIHFDIPFQIPSSYAIFACHLSSKGGYLMMTIQTSHPFPRGFLHGRELLSIASVNEMKYHPIHPMPKPT